jgi:thiol-disulfide isomerase/thioredoxin/Flp pilus assembly protein TadD
MNRIIGVVTALLSALAVPSALAQVLTVVPAKAMMGDQVTMTYDEDNVGAVLKGVSTMKGEVLCMLSREAPVLLTVPLMKKGSMWTGRFTLTDDRMKLLVFRVVSGTQQDNNGGNAWHAMVYGKEGRAVEDANTQRGSFLGGYGFMDFKHEKDFPVAYAAFAGERELYPGNWHVYSAEWSVRMRENKDSATVAGIRTDLDNYYDRFKGDEEAIASVLNWFNQTGQKERAEAIVAAAVEKNPKGPIAESSRRVAAYQERDPLKRSELLERFLVDFPQNGTMLESTKGFLASTYLRANQPEKALATIDKMAAPDPEMLNSLAWDWIEKGKNLEAAVQIAKKGVDVASHPLPSAKPTYLTEEQWNENKAYVLAMVEDTYGYGLYKLGRYTDAEQAFAKASAASKGEEPDITERLMMAYIKNGKFSEALKIGGRAVESGKTTDKLLEYYKTAYVKVNGSEAGFETHLSAARETASKQMKVKLMQGRLKKPAIQFTLKDIAGKTVKLSDLTGKVVVIDFWATWCGPCRESFPAFQKVYDKYKSNTLVAMYALDTWERVGGKEREELVRKFLTDNKYTFPVLYDDGVVEKYNVEGIPTKFVIDKKGEIAFKSVGFSGADEMITELSTQIDVLLAE